MMLVAIDSIFRKGTPAPCVLATYTMHLAVDVDVDEVASLEFVRMRDWKVFFSVIPYIEAKLLSTFDAEGMNGV